VQGQLCCWQTPRCHRTLLARSTGKATEGWATINALQFLESEPWINILTLLGVLAMTLVTGLQGPKVPFGARQLSSVDFLAFAVLCRAIGELVGVF
jgi:hypothetical protein